VIQTTNVGKDVAKQGPSLLVRMQVSTTTMKTGMEIPQKTKDRTLIWSSDTTLGILLKKLKTGYSRDTYTLIFIIALGLFTIAALWKQP
jgi:hypothetical protein